ncbi:MAG: hypothetical protein A2Z29_07365 [Chloroflexi bacterium RBG_16_56_11]|nr:MAG: hypothetical protein A2Z29_07365 [Chloroflexi bacterium RBG_16_56_11]
MTTSAGIARCLSAGLILVGVLAPAAGSDVVVVTGSPFDSGEAELSGWQEARKKKTPIMNKMIMPWIDDIFILRLSAAGES